MFPTANMRKVNRLLILLVSLGGSNTSCWPRQHHLAYDNQPASHVGNELARRSQLREVNGRWCSNICGRATTLSRFDTISRPVNPPLSCVPPPPHLYYFELFRQLFARMYVNSKYRQEVISPQTLKEPRKHGGAGCHPDCSCIPQCK